MTVWMRLLLCLSTVTHAPCVWADEPEPIAESIVVSSAVLKLIDEADAPAMSAGVVATIAVREGETVEQGQLLARLDDAQQRLAVQGAEIEADLARRVADDDTPVRYAAKAAETAAAELSRSQESIEKFARSISQSQIDVERLTHEKARLEHEQAVERGAQASLELKLHETRLEAARVELQRRRIIAPLAGVVVESLVRPGEWLEPGQKAFRIVRTDRLKAEGFVDSADSIHLSPGLSVRVGGPQGVQGRLVFVSPEVDPITNQVRVWAQVDNTEGLLRPGARIDLSITPASGEDQGALAGGAP